VSGITETLDYKIAYNNRNIERDTAVLGEEPGVQIHRDDEL
jgi:hypothetical protein